MKFITNMVYYILELVVGIAVLLSLFSYMFDDSLCAWISEIKSFAFIEKITVTVIIYQLIILVSLTLYDSIRRDAILSKITVFNFALINLEYNQPFVQIEAIKEDLLNDPSIDYKKSDREGISVLIEKYEMFTNGVISKGDYEFYVKKMLINLNHQYEFYNLAWRGSFVLRLKK